LLRFVYAPNKIDFNYSPFYENIGILGQQGEGKTVKANDILSTVPNIPRWIWSPQRPLENYEGYGVACDKIEDLQHGAVIWTGDFGTKTFIKFISRAFYEMKNLIVLVDDCHEQCTKQSISPEFEHFILSGRNRGLSGIYLSPFPNRVHNSILGSCQHMFAYRFDLLSQIEWMKANFFGDEAWLLLSKEKRRIFNGQNDLTKMPKHSFIYRKNTDENNQIYLSEAPEASIPEQSLNQETTNVIEEKTDESSDNSD